MSDIAVEKINTLTKSLEHLVFEVSFDDGSTLVEKGVRVKALFLKYPAVENDHGAEEDYWRTFIEEVQKHWDAKTEPTKFGVSGWKDDYKKKSELAEKVYYQDVRAALFGLILGSLGGRVDALCADGKTRTYK